MRGLCHYYTPAVIRWHFASHPPCQRRRPASLPRRAPRPFGERRSETQPQLRSNRIQAQFASHSDDALAALSTGAVFLHKQPQLCLICLDFLECALERGGACVHLLLLPAVQVRFCRSCKLLAYARSAEALLVQVAKP